MAEDRWSAIVDATSTDVNSVSPISGTKVVSSNRTAGDTLPATASDMWSRACAPASDEESPWDADDLPSIDDGSPSLPEARVFVAPNIVPLFVMTAGDAGGADDSESYDGSERGVTADSLRPTALPIDEAPAPATTTRSVPFTLVASLAAACLLVVTLTAIALTQHRPLVRAAVASSPPLEPVELAAPRTSAATSASTRTP